MDDNIHSGLDHSFSVINFPQTGLQVTEWWHFLNFGFFSQISLARVKLIKQTNKITSIVHKSVDRAKELERMEEK